MSGKTMTRRQFLRGSARVMMGTAAAYVLGKNIFPLEQGYAANATLGVDATSLSITRDTTKCIGCGKCVEICSGRQGLDILEMTQTNGRTVSSLKHGAASLSASKCIGCGQCARHCPSGCITVTDGLSAVNQALHSSAYRYVVWQFAPSAQHVIAEEFHMQAGTDMCAKLAAAIHRIGANHLAFSTDFGADMTIMEEATEFVARFMSGFAGAGTQRPFMTSCCPGWVNYVELHYPELIPHLSSCKSPMEMLGSLVKSYLPERLGVSPSEIFHVAVMPCTAKKYECAREEMRTGDVRTIDAVMTVVEFKNLMVARGIDLASLEDEEYNNFFNGTSGAGRIFGATGGVCEAALRTAYHLLTDHDPEPIVFEELRGSGGIKRTEMTVNGRTISACVVNGIANVKSIVQSIRAGTCDYDFIEVMACRGGCSGGGGTPVLFGDEGIRHRGLYGYDAASPRRSSHDNEQLAAIYAEYLGGTPCEGLAEEMLHTTYNTER